MPYVGYVGAIAAAMAVNAVLGIILERTAFRPFRGVELNGLIASMGMSIILVNIAELVWGTTPRPFDTIYNETSINFGTVGISVQRLICVAASAAHPARPVVAGADTPASGASSARCRRITRPRPPWASTSTRCRGSRS